ncbi:MAG TPA: ATP-binding cassette domain-containing protein [Candidatus Faecaligallichristensenella faecipullorum]|nr:ATP-binding cassette domain-containing protein [Candidatus Faecaligallichristensenella faecipullorum]
MALIEMRQITHRYSKNDAFILKDFSLSVEAGQHLAITGPSGSGKSTLLSILALLLRPEAGSYILDEQSTERFGGRQRAETRLRKIGLVVQDYALLSDQSALDNVMTPLLLMGGMRRKEIIERARAGLKDVGLEEFASRKAGQLSGGQRQRVAIARALIGNPAVILADEPTAQLDGGTARMITELLLRRTSGGTALIFATHDLSLTEGFDHVVQLRS